MSNDMSELAKFGEQIRRHVSEEIAQQYMALASQWISGSIRMDVFDRRGQRLNVPIDVHTKFMLEIGELYNIPFEDPNDRLIKKKSRKRKNPGSSSTSYTNATNSPINSPRPKETSTRRAGGDLSTRLVLFGLTNGVGVRSTLMATSLSAQDRAQDFANNLLFYAGLAKTPHKITETGFVIPESPIDYSNVNESDVCTALNKYEFLLPDAAKRKLLTDSLARKFQCS